MKKKNREVSVFSVSALDLFCSAMGVFMILFFINMSQSEDLENENTPTFSLHLYLETTSQNESISNRTWHTATVHDVDMIITAERPDEGTRLQYSPDRENRRHENSPALYITDGRKGQPDIWLHPRITPGNYQASFSISERTRLPNNSTQDNGEGFTEELVSYYRATKTSDNGSVVSTQSNTIQTYYIRGYRVKLVAIRNGNVIGAWAREMTTSEFQRGPATAIADITVTPENLTITPAEGVRAVENPEKDFLESQRF